MIESMTGFGEAQLERDGHAFHLELRSVNNRYFKASVRLPDELAFLELDLERILRKRLARGSVTLRLHVRDLSAAAAPDLNLAALEKYLRQLKTVSAASANVQLDLATLLTLPGVCQPHELSDRERDEFAATATSLTNEALEQLIKMRRIEGRALADDLQHHCQRIREHLDVIRDRGPTVVSEYRDRLTARIQELINHQNVHLAEQDLVREVAIYAERSDISEELSRLTSHLEQFDDALRNQSAAGRKLEFIAQEMLREANTIGSKAGDPTIAQRTIEIKGSIDRIKEQVQNVE